MLKRLICAILVLAMAGSLWYVASINYDSQFAETAEDTKVSEEGQEAEGAPVYTDDGSLTLWYTDEALTDYLTGVALSFEQDRGVKVNVVLKDGVQFLEAINENSLTEPKDRTEALCDLYITSHDNLLKAYLAGLAAVVNDPDGILSPELYPQTALNELLRSLCRLSALLRDEFLPLQQNIYGVDRPEQDRGRSRYGRGRGGNKGARGKRCS